MRFPVFRGQHESESELPILAVCRDHDLCDRAGLRKDVRGLAEFQGRHHQIPNFAIPPVYLNVLNGDLIRSGCDVNSCATNRARGVECFYRDGRFGLAASA